MPDKPLVVVPADHPKMIAESPDLEPLHHVADLQVYRNMPTTVEEQLRRVSEAEVMVNSRGHLRWPGELLSRLPKLRMISTCSIGVDAIDLVAAREQGIVVCNVPGRTANVVAEHALTLMMAVARRVVFMTTEMRAGRWNTMDSIVLRDQTLGVLGTGSIGREMIRLAKAIGMKVQAWTFNPSKGRGEELGVEFVELDALLSSSDVVSIHVKLTDRSRQLLGARELALMKPGALLVNTARGPVVDSHALVQALESGHLGGAALDVFDEEPLPPDNPILNCDQVVLTPHSADQNPEGRSLLNSGAVENVLAFLKGIPQNVVNPG